MLKFLGFAPDAEPQTPGAMFDVENIVPYESGMRSAPQPVSVGITALPIACRGTAVLRDMTGDARFFAGTASALYEASSTAWAEVSVSTAAYSLSTSDRWDFAQFGNTALVATPTQKIQRSTTGNFALITNAPKAHVIDSVSGFVMALNTEDTIYGTSPDRWWCSALYDDTDWAPSVATQSTTGRLIDGLGKLTAGRRFGNDFVAYKERGIFLGRYAGPPAVWQWQTVSEDVGCIGKDAIAITSIGHVFAGQDNVYVFDGTRPIPLGTGLVRQWWLDNSSGQYRANTQLLWDRQNNLVWMYFPSKFTNAGECDYCLVFHVLNRQWGRADNIAEAVVNYYTSGSFTYDGTSPLISTYDGSTGASIPYDSVLWLSEKEAPAIFSSTHQVQALEGGSDDSTFTTNDFGGDFGSTMCRGVRIKWAEQPSVADIVGYTKPGSGKTLVAASTADLDDSCFDVRQTGRIHRFKIDISGDAKFSEIDIELHQAGRR